MKGFLIWRKKLKNSVTYKFYLKCYRFLFLALYLIFIGLNIVSAAKLEKELTQAASELNEQNYGLFQDTLKTLDRISVSIASQSELRAYHVAENMDYPHKISNLLKSVIRPYTVIRSLALFYTNAPYDRLRGFAFTDAGTQNSEAMMQKYRAEGVLPQSFSLWDSDVISGRVYTRYPENDGGTILYFSQIPSQYPVSSGVILYELDEAELTRQIKARCAENSVFQIYDRQGNLLLQIGGGKAPAEPERFLFEDPYRGNQAVYQVEKSVFYAPLSRQLLAFLFAALFLAVILFYLSTYLAQLTYKPIARLSSTLSPDTDGGSINEIQLLEGLFDSLRQENQNISRQMANQTWMVQEQVAMELIRGAEPGAVAEHLGSMAGGCLEKFSRYAVYCCVIGTIDDYLGAFINSRSAKQQWLDKHTIAAFFLEAARENGGALCTNMAGSRSMVVLFAGTDAAKVQQELFQLCQRVREFIHFSFDFTVTFSIGWHTDSLDGVNLSYQDAESLTQYVLLLGRDAIINTERVDALLQQSSGKKQTFDAQIQAVLKGIRAGGEEETRNAVAAFFRGIQDIRDVTGFWFAYIDLLAGLKKLLHQGEIRSSETFLYHLEQQYAAKDRPLEEIESGTMRLCGQLCREFHQTAGESPSQERYQQILSYIIENLSDPNLCLNMVAEQFSMNPSYLTRLFKNGGGVTLMKYVDDLRFENSKALLVSTNFPIKDIVRQVGYVDENNFSRKFRAKEGIAPQKYRDLYRQ